MNNEIFIRRKNKFYIQKGHMQQGNMQYIATMIKNIENLGYTFSAELVDRLKTKTEKELEEFYIEIVIILKRLLGAHVRYNPIYPNFPEQVMEMEEVELYMNAIIHYWSFGKLKPVYEKQERLPLFDVTKVKVLDCGTGDEFYTIFKNLILSQTSLSETDKEDLTWFFKEGKEEAKNVCSHDLEILPQEIPLKENIALVGKLMLEQNPLEDVSAIKGYFKTATDVLRLATAMSDGDISLAVNSKFRSFKRKERRMLMTLLEDCKNVEEDMLRYKNRWIRLGERLHPSEYKEFGKVNTAFHKIRNNVKIETYGGKVAKAINEKEYKVALLLLKQRPGEFARKLDHLLRITDNCNGVINTFKEVAGQVATTVLLQVREHFVHRNNAKSDLRVFFPKGNVAKCTSIPNVRSSIEEKYCKAIVYICENTLIEIYSQKDFMGNVYLSEEFKNYLIPFSQRSASKALKTIVRGSRIPLDPEAKTIRSFIWWKNGKNRTDIDLSAVLYDENWNYQEHVSYTHLLSRKYKACHSGDITDAPNGASEFIDIDIKSAVKYGARYLVTSIFSFTTQPFCDLPECFMGWMEREKTNSGEIYEPKTVQNKIDLSANTQICIPMVIDLVDKVVIWTDVALRRDPVWNNNIEGNEGGIALTCKAMVELVKPNLYDLITLHIKAHGVLCMDKAEADIIFDVNEGITPFDTEVFMGEYI